MVELVLWQIGFLEILLKSDSSICDRFGISLGDFLPGFILYHVAELKF